MINIKNLIHEERIVQAHITELNTVVEDYIADTKLDEYQGVFTWLQATTEMTNAKTVLDIQTTNTDFLTAEPTETGSPNITSVPISTAFLGVRFTLVHTVIRPRLDTLFAFQYMDGNRNVILKNIQDRIDLYEDVSATMSWLQDKYNTLKQRGSKLVDSDETYIETDSSVIEYDYDTIQAQSEIY